MSEKCNVGQAQFSLNFEPVFDNGLKAMENLPEQQATVTSHSLQDFDKIKFQID